MNKEVQNNSFVFYATNLEAVYKLREAYPDMANELLMAICEYGIYGDYDRTNPLIEAMMINIGFGIDKAKDRYAAAVENGKKGGRTPIDLNQDEVMKKKKELGTWKNVANEYGITEQTLRNKRHQWEENQKNQKNLNDNDNVNDNVNDNEIDKIANHFSFGSAKQSIKELLDSGKSLEWVQAAIDKKGYDYFNNPSFQSLGLLFSKSYQAEIDELFKIKENNKAVAARLKQKLEALPEEEPKLIKIHQTPTNRKSKYSLDNLFNEYEALN